VLNLVPRHEDVTITLLSTMQWRRMWEWRYNSTHP
jgi:hypothetical protein